MNILTDGAREYGKYPVDIYGKRVLLFATILVPYACIQYYSPSFSPGSGQMVVWTAAGRRLPLSASLLCAVEDRGETL